LLLFPSFGFGFWLCVVDDEWIGEGWKWLWVWSWKWRRSRRAILVPLLFILFYFIFYFILITLFVLWKIKNNCNFKKNECVMPRQHKIPLSVCHVTIQVTCHQ
jgi:hypothetical protein